ncbi:MAG: AcvB/VirJ family lysyl-phosphatidylglycerol hydrolase [Candidatus Binatia bacterium]
MTFGRFGPVTLYHDRQLPAHVILFVSGELGWNQTAAASARALASSDALVVGIDLPQYLKTLSAAEETCSYPGGDFDALSKFIQQKYGFPNYVPPVLVGVAAGATFAYATVAQAPPDMFRGVITLGFCPELTVQKPLCEWNSLKWQQPQSNNHFHLVPGAALPTPWIALHGDQDQVCHANTVAAFTSRMNGTYMLIPQVGHDFSSPDTWLPQFQHACARLIATTAPTSQSGPLTGLPLVEVPAVKPGSDTLVVILSGDGGWASIDRDLADTLASQGVSVVGLNSLRYFWTPRTPEEAARDLERILRHYLIAWRKADALLIGYSRGADVLPFMANRLPPEVLSHVRAVALLGPASTAEFEFHLTDWLENASETGRSVLPEVEKLRGKKMLCVYGEEETDTLCKRIDPAFVDVIRLPGGHHFDGGYDALAKRILREVSASAGAQNKRTPLINPDTKTR